MARQFHIGDVLSITTDILLSPRHIEGIYDILNYMTGDNLFTHQLPRAGRICKPELLKQYPQLEAVDATSVTAENWQWWLDEQIAAFGEQLSIEPLHPADYEHQDAIEEAEQIVGKENVIIVGRGEKRDG